MIYALGIDPDTKNTGWGIVQLATDLPPRLYSAGVVKIPTQVKNKKITGQVAVALMARALYSMELPLVPISVIVVEGQTIYRKQARDKGVDPNAILRIAVVAGAAAVGALGNATWEDDEPELVIPEPKDWKAQVPKRIHQARVCRWLGLKVASKHGDTKTGYVVPALPPEKKAARRCSSLKPTHWKHAMDGVGLALYGLETSGAWRKPRPERVAGRRAPTP